MGHGAKSEESGVRIQNSGEKQKEKSTFSYLLLATDYFCVVLSA